MTRGNASVLGLIRPILATLTRLCCQREDLGGCFPPKDGRAGVVKFGSVSSTVLSWSDSRIVVRVRGRDYSHRVLVKVIPANRAASNGISFRIVKRAMTMMTTAATARPQRPP